MLLPRGPLSYGFPDFQFQCEKRFKTWLPAKIIGAYNYGTLLRQRFLQKNTKVSIAIYLYSIQVSTDILRSFVYQTIIKKMGRKIKA